MSENKANKLSVRTREVFGDKSKLSFSENPKSIITGVGLLSLAGGEYKHSHLKKIEDQMELKQLMKEFTKKKISFEELAKEKKKMNKYQEALNKIRNIVLDESGDGYYTQRYLQDFYSNACGTLQELVYKVDSFEWIPVSKKLPDEHDSIFAKLYGTDKWNNALWRTQSKEVLATIAYENGARTVKSSHTTDGKWWIEKETTLSKFKVIAWMPMPEPYKENVNETR